MKKLLLGRDGAQRDYIRYLAASNALDMVRRLIEGLPQDGGAMVQRIAVRG